MFFLRGIAVYVFICLIYSISFLALIKNPVRITMPCNYDLKYKIKMYITICSMT